MCVLHSVDPSIFGARTPTGCGLESVFERPGTALQGSASPARANEAGEPSITFRARSPRVTGSRIEEIDNRRQPQPFKGLVNEGAVLRVGGVLGRAARILGRGTVESTLRERSFRGISGETRIRGRLRRRHGSVRPWSRFVDGDAVLRHADRED